MIVYGRNPVREALRGRRGVRRGWASRDFDWPAELPVARVEDAELTELAGSPDHQGVCAEVEPYPYADAGSLLAAEDSLVVALDEVQDPHNLGAVARVAESAGAGLVIPERRSAEVTPAVCRASAGAVEHLALARVRNLADWLGEAQEAGAWVYGAAADSARLVFRARLQRAGRARAGLRGEGPEAPGRGRLRPAGLAPACAAGSSRSTCPPRRPLWCTGSCNCARGLDRAP